MLLSSLTLTLGLALSSVASAPIGFDAVEDRAFDRETEERLTAAVEAWHAAGQFEGAVLVSRGDEVWKGAAGFAVREWECSNAPDTRFPIASLTKQFTAVLAMRLVERGELDLDGTLRRYLPWYREDTGERITVRDLLSHTSGLPETPTALYLQDLPAHGDTRWLIETYCSGDATFEAGTDFAYTNTDYHLLGAILEAVSGRSFEALLEEEILGPLGMQDTGIARRAQALPRRAQDYVRGDEGWRRAPDYRWENWGAAGAMYSTVEDLLRWNRGLWRGRLLGEEAWRTMLEPRTDVGTTGNYVALGSWVYPRALPGSELRPVLVERRGAIGGFAALNVFVKDSGWSVVVLANHYNEQVHQLPWGSSMPLDLLLVLHGLEPQAPEEGR